MSTYRTHSASDLNAKLVGQKVKLSGWVHRVRDHGQVAFVDLRDRSGLCQVVVEDTKLLGSGLRAEFVVMISGTVRARPANMINAKMPSGEIELVADAITVLSHAEVPPFTIDDDNAGVNENTRLKYRYLDLRRPTLLKNFQMRHKILQLTRRYFDDNGFLEIETPILYKSTPEGARDYLVPSRVHPGEFFALPQSPQTLKQLLMIGGVERYCQIARCFRDEDLRADRQPEFTQIDIEASFLSRDEFLTILEGFVVKLWKECMGVTVSAPFRRMPYKEAMDDYGSDKPDLRFGLKLVDVSKQVENCGFNVFASTVKGGGKVIALPVRHEEIAAHNGQDQVMARAITSKWSRKFFDGLNTIVAPFGLKGVAYARVEASSATAGWNSPIAKFFKPEELRALEASLGLKEGDYVLFAAEQAPRVQEAMGTLRLHVARELGLIKAGVSDKWEFAWITEFPLFVYEPADGRLYAAHHPFTRPLDEDRDIFVQNAEAAAKGDPGAIKKLAGVRAEAYDLALNGFEVCGGSLRIYDTKVQAAMFQSLGLSDHDAKEKFGYFLEALQYGTPPHGGCAFGLDRLAMLMAGADSLRDVIAFPKTARAVCMMSESPSTVAPDQLAELRLQVLKSTT